MSLVWILATGATARGQSTDRSQMSGEALFRAACATCHAPDGKGQPTSVVGFDTPLPDFTDCKFTTPELDLDWASVLHMGGRARALSQRMPAFGDALTDEEILKIIDYVRGFCAEPGWPRGDLNFPRVFFTEKAFPENEGLLVTTVGRHPEGSVRNEFLYEHRIGRRAQYEINVPFVLQQSEDRGVIGGLGDVNASLKYTLFDSMRSGSIVSAGGEMTLPTGKETEGLGGGVTIFEGFALVGQALPRDAFFQFHAGFEVPANTGVASKEVYWRTALGKTYMQQRWGRSWSPMVELLGAKEIGAGASPEWDVVPQMQVSLSGLQHVRVDVGVRIPVNERASRTSTLMMYLLWDWFDGGLFSNWKTH